MARMTVKPIKVKKTPPKLKAPKKPKKMKKPAVPSVPTTPGTPKIMPQQSYFV
jgi:hypothetical protein